MKVKKDITTGNNTDIPKQENIYISARNYIIEAQDKVYKSVNVSMVTAYWNIGQLLFKACGENERAAYGKQLLQYIYQLS